MTKINQVYKCEICGNMVEMIHEGLGELVCCGQPMKLINGKAEDEGTEKHLPVVEEINEGIRVKIGSEPHPMEDKHYIEWIEVIANGKVYRKHLTPQDTPEAEFCSKGEMLVRAYCNIHGLWEIKSNK